MRTGRRWVAMVVAAVLSAAVGAEESRVRVAINIAPQPIGRALTDLGEQAGLQVLVRGNDVQSKVLSQPVKGEFTVRAALERVLANSGLTYEFLDERTVRVRAEGALDTSSTEVAPKSEEGVRPLAPAQSRPAPDPKEVASRPTEDHAGTTTENRQPVEEVIVTAQKRAERLQDVPVPVATVDLRNLLDSNQLRLQDYYMSVPGLSVTPSAQSEQRLAIRGITTGGGNPTVGVTVDEIPYGAATGLGGGIVVPDLDPGDLARIEVLRGPQGTLYGASSMGGLLSFVTVDPSVEGVSGHVQVGTSSVHNGDELGFNVRGSVNLPLSDTFAVRASAFTRSDPGYIDDPALGIEGVNRADAGGGRLSALWRPSESTSLKVSALLQKISGEGSSYAYTLPNLGELEQSALRGTGGYDRKVQAYSATFTADIGRSELTSLSGYSINEFHDSFDFTYLVAPLADALFGVQGSPLVSNNEARKFTQEIRLAVPLGRRFEWLIGVFYTDEDSEYAQEVLATNEDTGALVGTGLTNSFPTTYEEHALFTNLTVQATDRFDIQFGGRESEIRQTFTQTQTGIYVPIFAGGAASPFVIPEVRTSARAFTYLVTPRFKVSPDLMFYARLASGYRAGGPNGAFGVPRQFDPDKTQNYELGLKGEFFDRRLSVDASLYHIDWKDIQLSVFDPQAQQQYSTNGSEARSRGIELSGEVRPVGGLTIGGWMVWNDAQLTEDFPATSTVQGRSGDRLPNSSRFSATLSVEQEFLLGARLRGFAAGSFGYVGGRVGNLMASPERQHFPSYAKTDLRVGVKNDSWVATLFANNVGDERGILNGGLGQFPPFGFTYIQPRTVGVSFSRNFPASGNP